jgi:hypothetical protein
MDISMKVLIVSERSKRISPIITPKIPVQRERAGSHLK